MKGKIDTDALEGNSSGIMLADGFEGAFLGVAYRQDYAMPVAAYSVERCLEILVERDGVSEECAYDFFSYNVLGSYVGPQTPIFIRGMGLGDLLGL